MHGRLCSMLMCNMRLQTLRQVDLNLFVTFAVIAEEKSITAAAAKLHLSQPAVSRALKRARLMFKDDLLVRSPNGFELTLRGRELLDELNQLLPRMQPQHRMMRWPLMGLEFLSMPGLIMSDNDVRQPIVSIVSTGQMAAAIGARLQTNGVRVITPDGRSEASAALALAAGIEIVPLAEIGDSDFIFSIVPPAVADETAQRVAAVLAKGTDGPL